MPAPVEIDVSPVTRIFKEAAIWLSIAAAAWLIIEWRVKTFLRRRKKEEERRRVEALELRKKSGGGGGATGGAQAGRSIDKPD